MNYKEYLNKYYKGTDKAAFISKFEEICANEGLAPPSLAVVMTIESDLNPASINNTPPGAYGLNQLITPYLHEFALPLYRPANSRATGVVTPDEYVKWPGTNQLDAVARYFKLARETAGVPRSVILKGDEMYMVNFLPAYLKSYIAGSDDYIISQKGKSIYDSNAALDVDNDGLLTKKDIKAKVLSIFDKYGLEGRDDISLPAGAVSRKLSPPTDV